MSSPNGSLSMSYIGTDSTERTTAGSTPYTYNLLGLGTEKDSSGNVIAYTRDSSGNLIGERTKGGNYFYLFDGLGSVVGLVSDTTGAVVSNYIYDPYGVVEQQSGTQYNPWQFAGGYYDATTLYEKFGTRYYDLRGECSCIFCAEVFFPIFLFLLSYFLQEAVLLRRVEALPLII